MMRILTTENKDSIVQAKTLYFLAINLVKRMMIHIVHISN